MLLNRFFVNWFAALNKFVSERHKKENKFSFLRLGQIAYNIGQISVYIDSDVIYNGKPREFYYLNKLNKLESYVDISSCEIDSKPLEELIGKINGKLNEYQQTGGQINYYKKYLMYKHKYLALKNNLNLN